MKKNSLFLIVFLFVVGISIDFASASQPQNPRSGNVILTAQRANSDDVNTSSARTSKRVVNSGTSDQTSRSAVSARKTLSRSASSVSANTISGVSRAAVLNQSGTRPALDRSAASNNSRNIVSSARSATKKTGMVMPGAARASRATAVFNDVSKIGGGYAACRESYNTCMDQFCANANDTYRRCYCSDKITEFRNTEDGLDQAKILLQQFEDNNLNAIDKTAAEVNAIYSATVGEDAIKNDPSAAASLLGEIGDLLSGKKITGSSASDALSGASLDFTADIGDIFGDNNDSFFGNGDSSSEDLTTLEGSALYKSASSKCSELMGDSCSSEAIISMTKSAYNILISQDCNAYEKNIDAKKQAVEDTVREASKILREARLDEYRSNNSADVNECITKVKEAITQDTACGDNYNKCLDYTGLYINATTGEPIYSARLQDLSSLIQLDGANGNVIQANSKFNDFLDDKRIFVEKALGTCVDKAEIVWTEFKRSALIEIAQAQDERIEEVKDSCVSIMGECYDAQSGALADFDNTTSQYSAALGAYASRAMCADKVAACAAVYAGPNDVACEFDTRTGKLKNSQCGLASLLAFVNTVDTVKVVEGCQQALTNYATELCTPTTGEQEYPYACRLLTKLELQNTMKSNAETYCADPTGNSGLDEDTINEAINSLIDNIEIELIFQLESICESDEIPGVWFMSDDEDASSITLEPLFYDLVFGGDEGKIDWGYCGQNTIKYQCDAQNNATGDKDYAKYNSTQKKCDFTQDWYSIICEKIGGYWEDNQCYTK